MPGSNNFEPALFEGSVQRLKGQMVDISKSRKAGFTAYQPTDDAFFDLSEALRENRLIP